MRFVQPAVIEGAVGLVLAPRGRLERALRFRFDGDKIAAVEVVADLAELEKLDLAVL